MRTIRNSFGRLAVLAAAFFLGANFTLLASSYPSNTLWLSVASVSNGWVNLILNGTTPGTNYILLSKQTLAAPSWSNAGTLTGATNQSWTPMSVPVGAQSSYFFQAQSAAGQTTSTNLWLEIPTNGLAPPGQLTVVIHNTLPDQFYDVLTNSNLAAPGLWNVQQSVFGAAGDSTTVQLPMNGPTLFVRARFGVDSTGSGIPDWWWLQYFGSVGGDPFAFDPSGDGLTLWQDYWEGLNPTVFNTPPAPQGLTVSYNADSTATVSWLPSSGPVTGYTVQRDYYTPRVAPYDSSQTFNVAASTISLQDNTPFTIPYYVNDYGLTVMVSYKIQVHYAGGDSAWSDVVWLEPSPPDISLVAGPRGSVYFAACNLPVGTTALRLTRVDPFLEQHNGDSPTNAVSFDVPLSTGINGLYLIPTNETSSPLDIYGYAVYGWFAQPVNANGQGTSQATWHSEEYSSPLTSPVWIVPPYFDGRAQLKQNLIFLLRAATVDYPFYYQERNGPYRETITDSAAYAYSAFNSPYIIDGIYTQNLFDVFSPFQNNYLYRNFVFGLTNVDSGGRLSTGVGGSYAYPNDGGLVLQDPPSYQFQPPIMSGTAIDAMLATNQTQWLCSYALDSPEILDYPNTTVSGYLNEMGVSAEVDWDQSILTYSMAGNARNIYGLPFLSVKMAWGNTSGTTTTLSAGNSTIQNDVRYNLYPETAQPLFQTVEYDFWNPKQPGYNSMYWLRNSLPGGANFSTTNTSDVLIASVADPNFQVAGYAKLALLNSYPGVYGYLGQYFDTAYQIDANGNATTNTTGVLSPYGSFFATEPGPAALVTMPDVDPPYQRGTCTVYCVSMQVDKNSDGNMDLSFSGADVTSQASPYRIWVNNWHTIPGTGGNLDYDKENRGNTSPNYAAGQIICQRDLENFFRLWICGLPVLPANQGYTVTFSMSPGSGSPAINLYDSVETNGGTGYLTDTNIAFQQCLAYAHGTSPYNVYYTGPGAPIAKITPAAPFTFPASYFTNSGNKYFLFEGACTNGSGELVLTISQNGNTIAQTGVWLDLHDIKDFYEQALATNVTSGLPPSSLVSQCRIDHATVAAPDETKQIIVFVHGINNSPFDYFDSTETLFKRLYWSGYHGKVAGFRWPCAYLPSGNSINPADYLNAFNFNKGEFYAWKSAAALKDYLNYLKNRPDLAGYQIDIIAHSQGNIVASEAIKQGAPFDNYISTQAAVPAHCYDTSLTFQQDLLIAESYSPTPLNPANGGYHGYFAGLTGNLINFYNTNDYALLQGTIGIFNVSWEQDQIKEKPQNYPAILAYGWDGTNCFSIAGIFGGKTIVTDPYEQMSMVARSRTHALGAQPGVGGVMKTSAQIDLLTSFGFGKTRDDHSAQFTWPIQRAWGYYDDVLSGYGIQPIKR